VAVVESLTSMISSNSFKGGILGDDLSLLLFYSNIVCINSSFSQSQPYSSSQAQAWRACVCCTDSAVFFSS